MAGIMVKAAALPGGATVSMPERAGNKIILGLFVLMLTLTGAGAGGALMLKPATASTGRAPARAEAGAAVATYAALPTLNVTLNDGDRLRELRIRAVLELDPSVPLETVKPYLPRIADALSLRMMEVDPNELRGQDGPLYVKDALRFAANKAMRPLKVRQVLVQDMLLR
ncbi:flagellar basal body-associated FliL family protein [Azospirillum doebereinerae]